VYGYRVLGFGLRVLGIGDSLRQLLHLQSNDATASFFRHGEVYRPLAVPYPLSPIPYPPSPIPYLVS